MVFIIVGDVVIGLEFTHIVMRVINMYSVQIIGCRSRNSGRKEDMNWLTSA